MARVKNKTQRQKEEYRLRQQKYSRLETELKSYNYTKFEKLPLHERNRYNFIVKKMKRMKDII